MTFSHLRAYHFILFYFSGKTSKKCQFKKRHAMYCKLPWKNPCSLRPFCPPNSHAAFFSFLPFFPSSPTLVLHRMGHRGRTTQREKIRYGTLPQVATGTLNRISRPPASPSTITWPMNGLMNGCLEGERKKGNA